MSGPEQSRGGIRSASKLPYRDGNKRIGFLVMVTFLGVNGHEFDATDADVVPQFVALAAGKVSEDELTDWIRSRSRAQRR